MSVEYAFRECTPLPFTPRLHVEYDRWYDVAFVQPCDYSLFNHIENSYTVMNKRECTTLLCTNVNMVGLEVGTNMESEGKSRSTMALRLPVILREIFAYLPTEVLLVACSLVNTLWNTEARNFIRDYRRCRIKRWVGCPKNPQHDLRSCHSKIATEYTVLESLVGYDKICEDILGNGRAVPFNYMVLPEHSCCDWDNHCRTDDIVLRNLTGGMKFKYLEILGNVKVNCDCGKEIVRLLMQKCCDVKVLIISAGFRTFENLQILGWVPTFPKLEELDISSMRLAYPPAERDKLMLRWLLHNAPHIKSVRLESEVAALGILPTEILPRVMLVGSLNIDIRTNLGLELLRKACTAQSGLRELRLFGPTGNLREVGLPIERNTVMQFNTCLEQIIHMSHKSLESIRIFHGCTLTPVSHPPLTKLTYLCLDHMIYGDHEVWKAIVGLDFGKTMPVLVKVYLAVETDYEPQYGNVVHAATTVRSLEIRFGSNVTNVWPLPALFPNISDLDCVFKGRGNFVIDIFKNWRHLLDMRLTFDWVRGSTRNHDMDFCGIYEEEAEMLRHQDGVYLAKVHIVPVRPCLVTMLNLRTFSIRDYSSRDQESVVLISKVTRFIAFQRLERADAWYSTR